jgi:hypothetical protein
MAYIPREQIFLALFNLVATIQVGTPLAVPWKTKSRKLKLWNEVPVELRPALFMAERVQTYFGSERPVPAKRTYNVSFFIYTNAKNATDTNPGSAILNPLLDAIDAALAPNVMTGRNDLGGLVNHCFIDGDVFVDPGDIDGDGLAIIPVKIVVP